ncbi:GntR family transcriptional regulator [Streptomyces sp. NBC_01565]|uniref:GntR family transcriptional regulator n=1 Tax=Streptomyces sp. NBC_01565 TaxID=2975881 RepID=UPI00224EE153|nr:GntR family transcriptional regulator [Streptomyces sp. NBC_01565]MCX4547245.1 GntR family transcriptional regulator [Streptomyces sp. NBC_01565]
MHLDGCQDFGCSCLTQLALGRRTEPGGGEIVNSNGIAADIRRGIAAGQYRYGARLPSVRDLAERYEVSQQTVAAAYAVLAALGMVRTERGSGTVVTAGRSADAHLGTFTPPDLAAATAWKPSDGGQATEETTLVRQLAAPKYPADWGLAEGAQVVERTRIRSVDGIPAQHKMTVLPYEIAARAPEGHEGAPPMLAPVGAQPVKPPTGVRVADWLGWDVARTEAFITAEPMDPAASAALGMAEGTPGFRIANVTKDSEGNTVYVTVTTAPLHHRVTLDIIG